MNGELLYGTDGVNQMSNCDLDSSVPDWVIEHPETLIVFQKFGIDYCCGGKSLRYACQEQGLDCNSVMSILIGHRNVQEQSDDHKGGPCESRSSELIQRRLKAGPADC